MVMSLVKIGIFLESGEVQINDHALHMESDLIGYKQIGCQYIHLQLHIRVLKPLRMTLCSRLNTPQGVEKGSG